MTQSIIVIIASILIYLGILEFIARSVYGRFIPKDKLDEFFSKYFHEYATGNRDIGHQMFHGDPEMPYISTNPLSILSKWHISDVGRIPRSSAWSKKLTKAMNGRKQESNLTHPIDKYLD